MLICMRTTVRLDDGLLLEVKRYALKRHKTLTAVIEEALRETLVHEKVRRRTAPVKLTTFKGKGILPGIDLDDSAALLDALEGPHVPS